jgi:ATP-dependent DNA helicase RecG
MPGVGPAYAARLPRLGINTVRDLLYHFPRRYNDFSAMRRISQLKLGETETVAGTVRDISNFTTRQGKLVTTAVIADETGTVKAVWFNQAYMINALPKGGQVVISGKVDLYLGRPVFNGPAYENLETEDLIHTGRLVPVYPLTHEVNQRWLRRLEKNTMDRWAREVPDHLPASVLQSTGLPGITTALEQIHFPDDLATLEAARRRLAFDEFMLIQLSLLLRRRDWRDAQAGAPLRVEPASVAAFLATLPFTLTGAQQRALDDILADLSRPTPMARLLQGDVGSGKTVVAAAAVRVALDNGMQAAVMAPTEILAEQHFRTLSRLLGADSLSAGGLAPGGMNGGPNVRLLVGSQRESDKAQVRQEIAAGHAHLVVGTQTVIQESVEFARLGLVVIDEQHRFGVMQRAALRQKGFSPHVLAMTATPIPRTLALTLYGDLDLSVIGEMPPGRQAIDTHWLGPTERERAYTVIRREIGKSHQAFLVCPLVEESDVLEVKAATDEYERLRTAIFPDLRLGLLHGRMRPAEKDAVMRAFRDRELDILVSTPVIEVGIDIANATVMAIESAERFGLSQLHQFRGRVGRGPDKSYCLLLSDEPSDLARARLGAIERSHDGFVLAEEDLRMRGPGEFFGVRQSGLPDLKVARLSDVAVLELARAEAMNLFAGDPQLEAPEHQLLKHQVARFWQAKADLS